MYHVKHKHPVLHTIFHEMQIADENEAVSKMENDRNVSHIGFKNEKENFQKEIEKEEFIKEDMDKLNEVKFYKSYKEALEDRASENMEIVLSSLDYGYVDMALNLWETSFVKFGIKNFLFVCSDVRAQEEFHKKNVPCYLGKEDKDGGTVSTYGTEAFIRKTHIKTKIILEALQLGYSVLIVDVDIVFFKNPFPFLTCGECDLQIQNDGREINSGFYYVRPTKPAVALHLDAMELAHRSNGISNQQCLHRTLERMKESGVIKAKILEFNMFPVGNIFFEKGRRMFSGDNPCKTCVLVHDNWLVGGEAKVYRLKEFLLWVVDRDGYYSRKTTKYLYFENPMDFYYSSKKYEEDTLKAAMAIGHILNRTVILPTFHCYGCKYGACKNEARHCSLNTHFSIKIFDASFKGHYREHMFLQHPKVPAEIKDSQSPVILIESMLAKNNMYDPRFKNAEYDVTFTPKDVFRGAMSDEILEWFKTPKFEKFHVLRFHSLYGAFAGFLPSHKDLNFNYRLQSGFIHADYRQY